MLNPKAVDSRKIYLCAPALKVDRMTHREYNYIRRKTVESNVYLAGVFGPKVLERWKSERRFPRYRESWESPWIQRLPPKAPIQKRAKVKYKCIYIYTFLRFSSHRSESTCGLTPESRTRQTAHSLGRMAQLKSFTGFCYILSLQFRFCYALALPSLSCTLHPSFHEGEVFSLETRSTATPKRRSMLKTWKRLVLHYCWDGEDEIDSAPEFEPRNIMCPRVCARWVCRICILLRFPLFGRVVVAVHPFWKIEYRINRI